MRKKNKLYVANKYNQPLFAQGVDRENNNIFDGLNGSLLPNNSNYGWGIKNTSYGSGWQNTIMAPATTPYQLNPPSVLDITKQTVTVPMADYSGVKALSDEITAQRNQAWTKKTKFLNNMKQGLGAASTLGNIPTKDGNLFNTLDPLHHLAGGHESAVGNTLHTAGQGLFQAGAQSGNGWMMLAGGIAQGVGSLWNGALGTKWNDGLIKGIEGNTEKMRLAGSNFGNVNNSSDFFNVAGTMGRSRNFSWKDLGSTGWLRTNNALKRKARKLQGEQAGAEAFQTGNLTSAARRIDRKVDDIALANTAAYGGFLDQIANNGNMGAIEYGFVSDYLKGKQDQNSVKNNMNNMFMGMPSSWFAEGGGIEIKHPGRLTELKKRTGKTEAELWAEGKPDVRKMITFARNARKWQKAYGGMLDRGNQFALGGDIQNHGADWSDGLVTIGAGGSHEENPDDGVQVGVDSQGVPNKLEEGETVFNDYVFSNRITLDEEAKKDLHLPKKKEISYSEVSKRFEKEAQERPNDPYSQAALEKKMDKLMEHQERQKAEMEAARAREAFEALSPEEQANLMQYAQQQEQAQEEALQGQAMQEQAMAQQQGMGMSPEEQMYQQQMMAQQQGGMPMDAMMQQYPQQQQGYPQQGYAYGGRLYARGGNLFPGGGDLRSKLLSALGLYSDEAFGRWAKENKIDIANWDWEKALENQAFIDALTKDNTALAHAIKTGKYDFGTFVPPNTAQLTFTGPDGKSYMDSGNWTTANADHPYVGWKGSLDPINLDFEEYMKGKYGDKWEEEAMKMSRKDLEDTFKQMPSYQRTTKYLQGSADNILAYLNAVKNDPNIKNHPNAIKHYQKFINDDGTWKEGVDTSDVMKLYNDVFGEGSGNSGRIFYPGTYWHTPTGMDRNKQVKNWVKGPDGWELMQTDVPSAWKAVNTYSWANPESDITYNYYEKPGNAGGGVTVTTPDGKTAKVDKDGNVITEDDWYATPVHRPEWLRYAGLLGPAIGIGLWGAGVGKPNYKGLDAAIQASNAGPYLANNKYIGNYVKFSPFDIWRQQNRMDANTNSTYRALSNNAAPVGTKAAGILGANYGSQMGTGELGVKAQEYNNNLLFQQANFNKDTDKFNAEAYNRTALANMEALNRQKQYSAQLGMQAAAQKMAADAAWNQGLYGNIASLFKGIGDMGKENAQRNMIADMAADELFGVLSPKTHVDNGYLNWHRGKPAAEGGKINKKKNKRRGGLTF